MELQQIRCQSIQGSTWELYIYNYSLCIACTLFPFMCLCDWSFVCCLYMYLGFLLPVLFLSYEKKGSVCKDGAFRSHIIMTPSMHFWCLVCVFVFVCVFECVCVCLCVCVCTCVHKIIMQVYIHGVWGIRWFINWVYAAGLYNVIINFCMLNRLNTKIVTCSKERKHVIYGSTTCSWRWP